MILDDLKTNNQRISFSKKIKRKVLLEVASGKSAQEVFAKCCNLDFNEITTDEKYASKLLHKWRKEMYQNKEMLHLFHYEIDSKMIQDEIELMGKDNKDEFDLDEAINDLKTGGIKACELNSK